MAIVFVIIMVLGLTHWYKISRDEQWSYYDELSKLVDDSNKLLKK